MANTFNGRQWHIDTTAGSLAAPLVKFSFKPRQITYQAYTTATNNVVFVDLKGNTFLTLSGTTDLQEVRSNATGWIDGLQSVTITGNGYVDIYLE